VRVSPRQRDQAFQVGLPCPSRAWRKPGNGLVASRPLGLRRLRRRAVTARGGQCRTMLRVRDPSACLSGLRPWAPLPYACVLTPTVWCGFLCSCSLHLCAPRLPAHASRQLQRSGRDQAERPCKKCSACGCTTRGLGLSNGNLPSSRPASFRLLSGLHSACSGFLLWAYCQAYYCTGWLDGE
jgi:hypothetical protein